MFRPILGAILAGLGLASRYFGYVKVAEMLEDAARFVASPVGPLWPR
jgi:hypothetical protein